MTTAPRAVAGASQEYGRQETADWIGPTLERVAKSFGAIAPKDGGRSRNAAAFKLEWPPDVVLNEKLIEREDHDAAVRLARDYAVGYGSMGVIGGYGEMASAPNAGLIFDKRLQAVTHRRGTDIGLRQKRRWQFDGAIKALQAREHRQALEVAALTAIVGLSPLDGSPFMTFTKLGQWWTPPVTNPKQQAMAGKILVKMTCEALRKHYEAA